jgi:hypothetical protein
MDWHDFHLKILCVEKPKDSVNNHFYGADSFLVIHSRSTQRFVETLRLITMFMSAH